MRPWDARDLKILIDAHVESLRGGRTRPPLRRAPRRN